MKHEYEELRKRYSLKKGDIVQYIDYGGSVGIIPVSQASVEEAAGMLKGKTSLVRVLTMSR